MENLDKLKLILRTLRSARENKGLTQTELGAMIGIGLRAYQKIEDGEFPKYKKEHIKNIDKILETNIYELIYESKTVPPKANDTESMDINFSVVKMLFDEVAILKAKNEGITKDKAIISMKKRTKSIYAETFL